jgi:hypothetical protein
MSRKEVAMKIPVPLAALAALTACNSYPPPPGAYGPAGAYGGGGRTCFWASQVSGYRMGPNGTVIVHTNPRDYYELTTQPHCASRLDFENRMALRSRGGNFICSGIDAEIYVPNAGMSMYCPVYSVRKLSPVEVQAVRARR